MKLASLFSSGKDSFFAMYKAREENEIVCLISLISENPDSYMFHTPNINLVDLQSKALGIPLIKLKTKGQKEEELKDLEKAIKLAIKKYHIQGITTGALASKYQASRIQKICDRLKIKCINPLWQMDQVQLLRDLVKNKIKIIIVGVAAYPFDESWLGKEINQDTINELIKLKEKYKINPAGEGGEIETLVLDSPLHKKSIKIIESKKEFKDYSGVFKVLKAGLENK